MSCHSGVSTVCLWFERCLAAVCLCLMLVIIVTMAAQIIFRFVLDAPLLHSDEIAQVALTWLTFLGAAWVYRGRDHITVDLIQVDRPGAVPVALILFGEAVVLITTCFLLWYVVDAIPLMRRLMVGTLEMSRFSLHYLPLAIGLVGVVLFSLEKVLEVVTGHRPLSTAEKED